MYTWSLTVTAQITSSAFLWNNSSCVEKQLINQNCTALKFKYISSTDIKVKEELVKITYIPLQVSYKLVSYATSAERSSSTIHRYYCYKALSDQETLI